MTNKYEVSVIVLFFALSIICWFLQDEFTDIRDRLVGQQQQIELLEKRLHYTHDQTDLLNLTNIVSNNSSVINSIANDYYGDYFVRVDNLIHNPCIECHS
jgi:hypothetical protein